MVCLGSFPVQSLLLQRLGESRPIGLYASFGLGNLLMNLQRSVYGVLWWWAMLDDCVAATGQMPASVCLTFWGLLSMMPLDGFRAAGDLIVLCLVLLCVCTELLSF